MHVQIFTRNMYFTFIVLVLVLMGLMKTVSQRNPHYQSVFTGIVYPVEMNESGSHKLFISLTLFKLILMFTEML